MRPIINMSELDRARTGSMLKKFGQDRACGCGDILADRQTDILIIVVFATAPAGGGK